MSGIDDYYGSSLEGKNIVVNQEPKVQSKSLFRIVRCTIQDKHLWKVSIFLDIWFQLETLLFNYISMIRNFQYRVEAQVKRWCKVFQQSVKAKLFSEEL